MFVDELQYVEEDELAALITALHRCAQRKLPITLIGAGLVLIPLALLLFMPWEPQTKAIVGIAVGAVYLLVPLAAMLPVLSEKRWMTATGAGDTAKRLLE